MGCFYSLRVQKYNLIEEDIDIRNPKSYSYVFGGLKPLSVKIVETVFEKKGFKNMGSKCKFIRG